MRRVAITLVIAGCGPVVEGASELGTTTGETSGAAPSTSVSATTPSATSSDPTTTPGEATSVAAESTDTTDDSSFFIRPDGGNSSDECDPWAQDCPPGEKCMPWAHDGGNSWNATRCSPIDPNPNDVGEPCTVVGSGVSGIDDCVLGAMCWNIDPYTRMGECIAFCMGTEANPLCVDPCRRCTINGEGVLILCLPMCDPIAQDCDEGEACYPTNDAFTCAPDVSGQLGVIGDPCEFINVCDPGNLCANSDSVPGCEGSTGCCAPFCNADAEDVCDAVLPGTSCVPWYQEGQEPQTCIGPGTVGACVVPS